MRAFILKNMNWEEEDGIRVVSGSSFSFHHSDNIVAANANCVVITF